MKAGMALIFDMDGVLVDSTALHTEAWRQYLRKHRIEIADIEDRMLGRHNDEIVRDFFAGTDLKPDVVVRHGREKERLYRTLVAPELETRLIRGAVGFVRRYSDLPLGLASNAEAANLEFILEATGLRPCFRAVVNGHDVARPKPAPDIYLRVARLLGAPPEDCIVFEDSQVGIAAARAAGMRVVALTTTLAELHDADLTIAHFEDPGLEPWLRDLAVHA
jgi:beta-phosphoglucomutase